MKGRALSAILMLLVLLAIGLVSTPAFSGEHPWDSDLTGDERPTSDVKSDAQVGDSIVADLDADDIGEGELDGSTAPDTGLSSLALSFFTVVSIGF
jgi:hypothetical protein